MKKYTKRQLKERHRVACEKGNHKHKKLGYFKNYYQKNKETIKTRMHDYYKKHMLDGE